MVASILFQEEEEVLLGSCLLVYEVMLDRNLFTFLDQKYFS